MVEITQLKHATTKVLRNHLGKLIAEEEPAPAKCSMYFWNVHSLGTRYGTAMVDSRRKECIRRYANGDTQMMPIIARSK
jgi:hypothetical protein